MGVSQDDKARELDLEVYLLGALDYDVCLELQQRLVYDVSGSDGRLAALILCEHFPTISVGRLGSRSHIQCDDRELEARRLPVRWINRGGGCNLHVPGQLAAYPIMPLRLVGGDLGGYVRRLKRCVVELLQEFQIDVVSCPDHDGIWTPSGQIGAVGIAVTGWVSYHGFTLNVSGRLDRFRILNGGPGRTGRKVTTVEAQRQRPVPMPKLRECLVRKFTATFGIERYHIHSDHPILKPRERRHVYAESVSYG